MTSEPITLTTVEMALEMLYCAKRNPEVAYDERLKQAHAVNENRVARGHDRKAGGHHEPAGKNLHCWDMDYSLWSAMYPRATAA